MKLIYHRLFGLPRGLSVDSNPQRFESTRRHQTANPACTANRHLAVQALALMDVPEAQRKVLESTKSEEISEAERIQAILLLSRTDLTEAIGYLQELTIAEYRKYALESLDAIQERRARNR